MAAGRVAVVGGGLAGLAAGLALKRAGWEVTLYERTRLLGGKATSFEVNGVEVDNGQHVFLACCTELLSMLAVLGLDRHVRMQERFEVLVAGGGRAPSRLRASRLPAPWHLVAGFAGYRQLSWRAKLEVARALAAARRRAANGETFARWLDAHGQGAQARRRFWEPFFVPALNARLEDASAEDALFVARTAFLEDAGAARFGWLDVPLARLAERAAERLDAVHLRTPVSRVRPGPELELAGGEHVPFDAAVLAVPPDRLARLGELGVEGLAAFRAEPIVDVHLWYDRELDFEFAAVLESPVQWVFRKGAGYLCCSISAAAAMVTRAVAELASECDAELRRVFPALRPARLLQVAVTRDLQATFLPVPRLRRPGPRTTLEGVFIAGAWTATGWPATMESAVRSGHAAAAALMGDAGSA